MISWGAPGPSPPASAQVTSALVSAARPGAPTPSSLVTRILTYDDPTGPGSAEPGRSPGVRGPVTGTSRPCPRPPHPCGGPGLLQFTRNAGPHAQDLRRLAHGPAVAHRARSPG